MTFEALQVKYLAWPGFFDITLPDHLGIYRQRTWKWPGFWCRSSVPFENLWAKHLAWLGFLITLPDHLGIYRQRTWAWPGFLCRSAVPFKDLWAKHLAWLGFLISLYQTTWGFIGRGPRRGQAFVDVLVDPYLSIMCDKSSCISESHRRH